jgi:hemerythrin-like domain-containing protein
MISLDQLVRGGREEGTTLDRPLEHLVACHRRIEDRLRVLERAGEALEAITNCFRFFDSNGAWHTADEEDSLFPRMQAWLKPEEQAFLEQLEREHQEAEGLYCELKELAAKVDAGRFRTVLGRLCELYRRHIAAEDETLISIGSWVLTEAELREISAEMKARRGLAG